MLDTNRQPMFLDMTRYQWIVMLAAWLGWGFDVFDSLLFNFVAPTCVPALLQLQPGTLEAKQATIQWTGIVTSTLLLGWAIGGIVFGRVADKIGRTRTLLLTMLLYSIGTAACAAAPNIWVLLLCRIVASLGIGGEWAAGASMVAEVVPEKRRVEAGALLYTSAPLGLFLATFVTYFVANAKLAPPEHAWRIVFLTGLAPAAVALLVRLFVREPERWKNAAERSSPPRIAELFTPQIRPLVISGFSMALIALVTWWSCNAFLPIVATQLSQAQAKIDGLSKAASQDLAELWKVKTQSIFNLGGLIGTLLTVPIAKRFGRKRMFFVYYLLSGLAIMGAYGFTLTFEQRLYASFLIGLTVFGVFGSFTYYLPELFPTRLRGTGAGFSYNVGRIITAAGPFLVGYVASRGADALMRTLFWVGAVPLAGLFLLPLVIETKDRLLAD